MGTLCRICATAFACSGKVRVHGDRDHRAGVGIGAKHGYLLGRQCSALGPMPYRDPDRLVNCRRQSQVPQMSISYPNFLDWREQNQVFESIAAMQVFAVLI